MFKFKGIAARIAWGYIIIILFTTMLLGISFGLLMSRQLEKTARASLFQDAQNMVETLDGLNSSPELENNSGMGGGRMGSMSGMGGGGMRRHMYHRVLGRTIQGEYLVVNPQGIIIDSSVTGLEVGTALEPATVARLATTAAGSGRITLNQQRYMAVAHYLQPTGGAVILMTRVEGLSQILRDLIAILVVSLIITVPVALAMAVLLARRISHPLQLLQAKARQVAKRDFSGRVELATLDEIGELGETINTMGEKLAAYDMAQKQFFQNASHELKSPLMSIQGYAEGIKENIFNDQEKKQALLVIERETKRLKNIVEELVYLGHLDSLGHHQRFENIDLIEVLEQAVAAVQVVAQNNNITLQLQAPAELAVWADGEKLVRVFVNLLTNAVRYAQTKVQITLKQYDAHQVQVVVQDDGAGFTAEDLKHLWDRFYKDPRGGSGLGLAITKAIVEQHGGLVQADNRGGGAQVVVILPIRAG